uniref:Drought induced 19 protein type zinc-binding domain-containing protein n=1 Tax=Davidia involucrata TaxID=16924 RepID=A0A5B6ZKB3_DAVIN
MARKMDVDFWASRVHSGSAKHLSAVQAAGLNNPDNHLNINDSEGDDDTRAYFPCPFCYVDIEVPVLCSHLQEEHCFDFKNVVCPLCAANLGKDVIGHFTVQHAHSVKWRKKSQKSGLWTNSSAMLGKDLRQQSNSMNGRGNVHETAPDPLLSPFLFNIPLSDPKSNEQDECSSDAASTTSDVQSGKSSILDEVQEEDYEERSQRAAFCQQLILSTIF